MSLKTLFPALIFTLFCYISCIIYKWGFFYYAPLKTSTYIYVLTVASGFLLLYIKGFKKEDKRQLGNSVIGTKAKIKDQMRMSKSFAVYKNQSRFDSCDTKSILIIFLSLSIIGQLLQFMDIVRGGVTLETAIEYTSFVRSEKSRSILSTLSVLFLFFWLPAIVVYIRNKSLLIKNGFIANSLMISNIVFIVINSIINVNRNPILNIIIIYILYIVTIATNKKKILTGKKIVYFIVTLIILIGFYKYTIFINTNRTRKTKSQVEYLALQSMRYNLNWSNLSSEQLSFLPTSNYYFSHQLIFVQSALDHGKLVNYDFTLLDHWLWRQLREKFPVLKNLRFQSTGYIFEISGIPEYTWPSLLGAVIAAFGKLFGALFIFVAGYYFGKITCRAMATGSVLSYAIMFYLFYVFSFSHKYFTSDHYTNGLMFFIITLIILIHLDNISMRKKAMYSLR